MKRCPDALAGNTQDTRRSSLSNGKALLESLSFADGLRTMTSWYTL